MTGYAGRRESCTAVSKNPDYNLSCYAQEQGFSTALIGVVFATHCGELPKKVYSYWGHTGIKRGHYVQVLVPRGNSQEEVIVKVVSVLPAIGLKHESPRAAKHVQTHIGVRPRNTKMIRSPHPEVLEAWRIGACNELKPMVKTDTAKKCVDDIGIMLGMDLANGDDQTVDTKLPAWAHDDKIDALQFGFMATKNISQEEFRQMYQMDFAPLEARVGAAMHKQLENELLYAARPSKLHTLFRPSKLPRINTCRAKSNISFLVDDLDDVFPIRQTLTGRWSGSDLSSNLPKENTVSAKIENVTYVTLPSGNRYDAKNMTAQQFFTAIGELEKEVHKLEAINHKPRALQEKIDELNTQIIDLSALCDTIHASKEPAVTMEVTHTAVGSGAQSYSAHDVGPGLND